MEISEIVLIIVALSPFIAALIMLFNGYKNIKSNGAKFVLLPMLLVVLCVPLFNIFAMMGIAALTEDDSF
jgi:hypothetical protein